MPDDRSEHRRPASTPAERRIERSRVDDHGMGALSSASLHRQRTVEAYLRAGVMPRYMERLREIHQGTERHRRELAAEHERLRETHAGDPAAFADAWRERVAAWRFDEINELIRQHNDWYPIERDLPMDPRTRDYVLIAGRPYRREELTPDWALRQFPPGDG
jgi:hypothetical protein